MTDENLDILNSNNIITFASTCISRFRPVEVYIGRNPQPVGMLPGPGTQSVTASPTTCPLVPSPLEATEGTTRSPTTLPHSGRGILIQRRFDLALMEQVINLSTLKLVVSSLSRNSVSHLGRNMEDGGRLGYRCILNIPSTLVGHPSSNRQKDPVS